MIKLGVKFAGWDLAKIERDVDRGRRRVLARPGAFIRRDARRSIRRARSRPGRPERVSRPGKPPLSKTGFLRQILFAYDPKAGSMLVGPVKARRASSPLVLEEGGRTSIRTSRRGKGNRRRRGRTTVRIEPRPFMRPALDRNRAAVDQAVAQLVRGLK